MLGTQWRDPWAPVLLHLFIYLFTPNQVLLHFVTYQW